MTETYKGIPLVEVTHAQAFDEPVEMLAWNDGCHPTRRTIVAVLANGTAIDADRNWIRHCAFIPEVPESKRATNLELAKWLAMGNGEVQESGAQYARHSHTYKVDSADEPALPVYMVRKWGDADWHEPTLEYLGLEDK